MPSDRSLPSSFDGDLDFFEESRFQKFARRIKEEPLVPFGILLTSAALIGASRSIREGDHHKTNRMFRARIYAQAFTLIAVLAGSFYWEADRKKRKEFEGVLAEQKAKEKRDAWIRELEARDREDKAEKAAMERRRARAAASKSETTAKSDTTSKSETSSKSGTAGAAKMVDGRERRRGTLEMVSELVYGRK